MTREVAMEEARLEAVGSGLAPAGEGWFVVNVADAAWLLNESFGARCVFEARPPVVRGTDLPASTFPDLGVTLAVLEPGRPSGLYHAESAQEDFLVLAGECLLIVEGQERTLRAWDFVHCPPDVEHVFVGAGEGPCVLLMLGARPQERTIRYPESEAAGRHGGSVAAETDSPAEAYAAHPHWQRGRPAAWKELPWTRER
jgi:uncharacterized cupin superfamily protein